MAGPFYKLRGDYGGRDYSRRIWYTQPKPYRGPLPYQYEYGIDLRAGTPEQLGAGDYVVPMGGQDLATVVALENRLREKFYSKLGDSSMWAVNLLEAKQSIDMIAKRSLQLVRFVRAVKKLDFGKASKELGVKTPKGVSRKRQASNNFLEYHFGWAPLVDDIGNAVETLQRPLPQRKIRVSVRDNRLLDFPPKYPRPGTQNNTGSQNVIQMRAGARVIITNPDLYLANQLGFTNPAGILWEAIPFSFVVDWFLPVGSFLNAMTATLGVQIVDPWHADRSYRFRWTRGISLDGRTTYDYVGWGVVVRRHQGAVSPYPTLRPTMGFSPMRAVTSMALLIQSMRSLR